MSLYNLAKYEKLFAEQKKRESAEVELKKRREKVESMNPVRISNYKQRVASFVKNVSLLLFWLIFIKQMTNQVIQ